MSPTVPPRTPYRGLVPYTEDDAPFFFGRESEAEIVAANLMASRLTLLYGPSGVGKTSLLHAGVLRHLRSLVRRNLAERGVPDFAIVVFSSWRDDPIESLSHCIEDTFVDVLDGRAQELDLPPSRLDATIKAWTERIDGDVIIIPDQFEEYFL
jgi:hypothetical protein